MNHPAYHKYSRIWWEKNRGGGDKIRMYWYNLAKTMPGSHVGASRPLPGETAAAEIFSQIHLTPVVGNMENVSPFEKQNYLYYV